MWCKEISLAAALTAALAFPAMFPAPAAAGEETMTLRVNDARGEAGGLVALVLRTYASRPVEQGQICVRAALRGAANAAAKGLAGSPFTALEDVVVFSEAGDAVSFPTFDGLSQTALLEFTSPSASVNTVDGPLAVLFFRLHGALAADSVFDVVIDLPNTFLLDDAGATVPLEPRAGVLTVAAPGAPRRLGAEGDVVAPGAVAALGVETLELFPIASGLVAFTYDPAVAAGTPQVTMDPRHGDAIFEPDTSLPGRVLVAFESPDHSLNSVPGVIVSIRLPTSAALPAPSTSPVALDPALTSLIDPDGLPIPLELTGDVLEIGGEGLIFADGFESGDTAAWSRSVE